MEMDPIHGDGPEPSEFPSSFRLRLLALAAEHEALLERNSTVVRRQEEALGAATEAGLCLSDLPAIPVERTPAELHAHLEDRLASQHRDVKAQLDGVLSAVDLLGARLPAYRLSHRTSTESLSPPAPKGRTIQIGGVSRPRSECRKQTVTSEQASILKAPHRPSVRTCDGSVKGMEKTVSFFNPAAAEVIEADRPTCRSSDASSTAVEELAAAIVDGDARSGTFDSADSGIAMMSPGGSNGVRFMTGKATKRPVRQGAGLGKAKTVDHLARLLMSKHLTLGVLERPGMQSQMTLCERLRVWVCALLGHRFFDAGIGVVIFVNSICIGMEITLDLNEDAKSRAHKTFLESLEHIFLTIYGLELFLRFFVEHWRAALDPWVAFDSILVFLGIGVNSFAWIYRTGNSTGAYQVVERVMVLRVLRLLRLVRALRLMRQFKTLWRLVSGLLGSMDIMVATVALTTLVLYVAACVGVELITRNDGLTEDDEVRDLVALEFSSIPVIMMTLVQFVTQDSISAIYKPMILASPMMALYFLPIFLVVSIVLLNLVTAVLVEGFFSSAATDKDMRKHHIKRQVKQLVPLVREFFSELDSDDSGVITLDEVKERLEGDPHGEMPRKLKEMVCLDSVLEFFEAMDQDGDGQIPEEDFINAVLKAAIDEVPIEFSQILLLLRLQRRKLENVERALVGRPESEYYVCADMSEQTR